MRELENHRQPWTAKQIDELRSLAKDNTRLSEIARKLGRTPEAIQSKADAEGVRLVQRHKRSIATPARATRKSAQALELDRKRLMTMLGELRSGKLGELPEAEAEQLITAIEQRLDALTKELDGN